MVLATDDWKKSSAKPLPDPRERTTNPSTAVPGKSAPAAITSSPRFSKIWATLAFNALNTTNASGATIFLREGSLREGSQFACVARFGKAPTVGTTMRTRGGLFTDCIEARQLVVCNENAASKLHDLPYKQRPNCTSAALVPFELEGRVEGVLAVFSTFPAAFRQTAWDKLSAIAMVIESVLFSVSFAKNAPKFGSSAAALETPAAKPPFGSISPPASYDSDQDFLRHMSSMLPSARGTSSQAEAEVDPIDAILAKVCGDLDLISGRASRTPTKVSLESALTPESAASSAAFNFDDELRAAEMQGLEAPETFLPASRPSAHNDRVTKPPRPEPRPAIAGFDLSGLTIPEGSETEAPAIDDAQAAVEELMRQAGSHVDNDVATSYLSQLGDLFSQPQAATPLEPKPAAALTPEPQTRLPELLFSTSSEAARTPELKAQPPVAELPPPADEDTDFETRYSLSPWAITLLVVLVALIVAGALLWSH